MSENLTDQILRIRAEQLLDDHELPWAERLVKAVVAKLEANADDESGAIAFCREKADEYRHLPGYEHADHSRALADWCATRPDTAPTADMMAIAEWANAQ